MQRLADTDAVAAAQEKSLATARAIAKTKQIIDRSIYIAVAPLLVYVYAIATDAIVTHIGPIGGPAYAAILTPFLILSKAHKSFWLFLLALASGLWSINAFQSHGIAEWAPNTAVGLLAIGLYVFVRFFEELVMPAVSPPRQLRAANHHGLTPQSLNVKPLAH